jgi:2-phospho-L-lactate/phosphoenolpyruvate guanylyltransferase
VTERLVAIVPIRSWRDGKTRLAAILSPEAREALVRQSAASVLRTAARSLVFDTVLVVSADPQVLAWASRCDAPVLALPQPEELPGLNGAVEAGRRWARDHGADRIVSLFADLPLLTVEDVQRIAGRPEPLVLGPDRSGEGTNALLLRITGEGARFRFAFGEGSLARHEAEARRLKLNAARDAGIGIAFDLDTPQDWTDFLEAVANTENEEDACPMLGGVCAG